MDIQRLAFMANQIARNLAIHGDEAAIAETAAHIRAYWDPRMRAQVMVGDPDLLDPIARAAVARLDG